MEVGAQFSWVEVDRAGWSWVEVDGAGWRSMHPPPSTYIKLHPALRLAIQKTIVGIRISILDIPCVPIFSQNEQL